MKLHALLSKRETQVAELLAWGREQKGSGKQAICFHANRREHRTEHIRKIGNTEGYGIVCMVVLYQVRSTRKS